jgi:hypothetical protein
MRRRGVVAVMMVFLVLGACSNARAVHKQFSLGAQGSWGDDTDVGLGARVIFDLGFLLRGLEFTGSFDYFFPGEQFGLERDYWEVNTNAMYRIDTRGNTVIPYAGAGFNVARRDVSVRVLDGEISGYETSNGVNLLGGLLFDVGGPAVFVEGRMEVEGGRQFVATVGARY